MNYWPSSIIEFLSDLELVRKSFHPYYYYFFEHSEWLVMFLRFSIKNNVYKYVDIVGQCWYVFSQFSKNSWRVKFSLFLSFAWNWKTAGKKLKTNFAILKVPFLDFFFSIAKIIRIQAMQQTVYRKIEGKLI